MANLSQEASTLWKKAQDAASEAGSNPAQETRAVDALGQLEALELSLADFRQKAVQDAGKGVKSLTKKGATDKIKEAARKCKEVWSKLVLKLQEKEGLGEKKASSDSKEKGGAPDEISGDDAREGGGDDEQQSMKTLIISVGNPPRDRTRELIGEALALCKDEVHESLKDIAEIACAVEEAMFNKWPDCGKDYKAKFRQLSFNLKDVKNPDLRKEVTVGGIAPAQLLELPPEQLGSSARRAENDKIREHAIWANVRGQQMQASTDAFRCGKCKQRQCTYYQLQTRSADEPMTTFVTCVACGNRYQSHHPTSSLMCTFLTRLIPQLPRELKTTPLRVFVSPGGSFAEFSWMKIYHSANEGDVHLPRVDP